MAFFRQKYWSELQFPTPGDLPDPGNEPMSLLSPALASRFFTAESPENPTEHPICAKHGNRPWE